MDDDTAFGRRIDGACREIGERGKYVIQEAVPPAHTPIEKPPSVAPAPEPIATISHAPMPHPAPAPAPRPTEPRPAVAATPPRSAMVGTSEQLPSPNLHPIESLESARVGSGGMCGSLAELTLFLSEQQRMQLEREDKLEAKLEAQRREAQAEVERHRQEIEQLCKPRLARDAISDEQLEEVQSRLETLHEARLLTDEELESLEDMVVDCIEVLPQALVTERGVEKVIKMILITQKVANDKTLARQLRRKFV